MLSTGYGHINGIIESTLKILRWLVFFKPYSKNQWILESRFACREFSEGTFSSKVKLCNIGPEIKNYFRNLCRGNVLVKISWRKCTRSGMKWWFSRISINTNIFLLNGIGAIQHLSRGCFFSNHKLSLRKALFLLTSFSFCTRLSIFLPKLSVLLGEKVFTVF